MSLKTEKLSQLEVLESAEGTHVLVEQDGTHKRVPADKIGGGVGTPNAVQYTSQELTEEQQMQARANLRLYRKENVVLFPEAQVTVDPDAGGVFVFPGVVLEAGKTYMVKWNGVTYTCTAFTTGKDAAAVGNIGATEEPFAMAYSGGETVGMALDESETATVEIVGENAEKLPHKFYDPGTFWVDVYEDTDGDTATKTTTATVGQVKAALNTGMQIVARINLYEDGILCERKFIPLVNVYFVTATQVPHILQFTGYTTIGGDSVSPSFIVLMNDGDADDSAVYNVR